MSDARYLLEVFGVMAAATYLCRLFPFLVPKKVQNNHRLRFIGDTLPAAVMLLLVVYCLKDVDVALPPHGAPEFTCVLLIIGLHLWRRNSLLSIGAGTAFYIVLSRYLTRR